MDEPFVIDEKWLHEWFEWGYQNMMYFLQLNAEFEDYCNDLENMEDEDDEA